MKLVNVRIRVNQSCGYIEGMCHLFTDNEQACDSIYRDQVIKTTKGSGVHNKLILSRWRWGKLSTRGKNQGKTSHISGSAAGLGQINAVATLSCNLCLEEVIRNVKTNPGETISNSTRHSLLHADVVVVVWGGGGAEKHMADIVTSPFGDTISASNV